MNQAVSPDESQAAFQKALHVKKTYEASLMAKPGVIGVGIGKTGDDFVLVVLVTHIAALSLHPRQRIPDEIEGLKVEIRQIGQPGAQQD
jgi:hypothetical protein